MSLLKVENVSKSFDGEKIIEDISVELKEGELVSLLGVSGGGKTTLFNIIAGLKMPDEGSVVLDGENVTGKPGKVSYMLQKDLMLPYRTIVDNVALPLLIKGMKKNEAREKAASYFEQFGLLSKTGIDLPGEAGTIMHKKENMGEVELATVSFGQSFQVSPIQMLTTVSSLINGGNRITPHFGVEVRNSEGEIVEVLSYNTKEDIISEETSERYNIFWNR